jgi:hypothetical protein
MLSVTGRLLLTWLRVTFLLGLVLLVVGWVWGFGSGAFVVAVLAAVGVELLTIRGLAREWAFEARCHWWWV